jgi:hypothetical protein
MTMSGILKQFQSVKKESNLTLGNVDEEDDAGFELKLAQIKGTDGINCAKNRNFDIYSSDLSESPTSNNGSDF